MVTDSQRYNKTPVYRLIAVISEENGVEAFHLSTDNFSPEFFEKVLDPTATSLLTSR